MGNFINNAKPRGFHRRSPSGCLASNRACLVYFGRMIYRLMIAALLVFVSTGARGQLDSSDYILTMAGRSIPCDILDTLGIEVMYNFTKRNGKVKRKKIHRSEIFAVLDDGKRHIYYEQDSLLGNWMPLSEVEMFIAGEQDARDCLPTKGAFWFSFGSSAALAFLAQGGFLATLSPPLLIGAYHFIRIMRIPERCIKDPLRHQWQEPYALGFEKAGRPLKVMAALKGGGLGMVLGAALVYVIPI